MHFDNFDTGLVNNLLITVLLSFENYSTEKLEISTSTSLVQHKPPLAITFLDINISKSIGLFYVICVNRGVQESIVMDCQTRGR